MANGARYYQPIQGSARLATAPLEASPELARAEALAAGDMRRVPFEGELVGAARVRGRCAAIPLDAFDSAGARLEPEEQGAYFQLLRLSYAEGRNFCRLPKRELVARLGTSERRLHRIVDGLVRKGFVKLLHRDNRGTAFRVYLPREAAGEPGDDVVLGVVRGEAVEPARATVPAIPARATLPARATVPARAADPARAIALGDARTRSLAAALADARGSVDAGAIAAALREISDLVADGATPRQVEAAIRAVARRRAGRGASP
ncbi:MAG TPA: hypothetical protein VFK85_12330 [Anaeromyxobacteraceae bacterium]|nr:hypothetical protein [Anaeromyxobacteraceae bacterium]